MKIQYLLLFCISIFCACQIAQKAQTNHASNKANFNQQPIINSVETRPLNIEESKTADSSKFLPVTIKKTIEKPKFFINVDIKYPKFKNASTSAEIKFNQYVKKQVDEELEGFTNFLLEKEAEVKSKIRREYEIKMDYEIKFFSKNLLVVSMNWHGYTGGMNEDYFPSTVNFDLTKGSIIKLENLFEQNSNYLEKLSELAIKKLNRTCLSCPCENGIDSGEPLPEGINNNNIGVGGMFDLNTTVSAKKENFTNWAIMPEGLKISFAEYQVGPGCIGIIKIVIPFEDLQLILRKDTNFK